MPNTITGRIFKVGQTVNVSREKEFLKRELVLDCSRYDEYTGEKRENYVTFSFTQKRCEELNGYMPGELVEVSFVLNGRKYEKDGQTRYITDIVGYKVERKESRQNISAPQAVAPASVAPQVPPQPQYAPQYQPQPQYQQAPQYAPQGQQYPPQGNPPELPF